MGYNNAMELQVGVKALLKNKDGKYLLVRRSPKKYPEVGAKWDIVGGRINPGASLLDNLKREIKEETDLDLAETPRLIAAQDILRPPEKHIVRLTYLGTINGQPKLDDENLEYRWFTMNEIKALDDLDSYVKKLVNDGELPLT